MDGFPNLDLGLPPLQKEGQAYFIAGIELWDWWVEARGQAIAHTVPIAELEWLLQEVAELDRLALRLGSFQHQLQIQLKLPLSGLEQLWQQRLQARVPVQYLIGRVHWRHFVLRVSPAVLIPRPETEILIDLAIAATQLQKPSLETSHWADLGTGSGAIALGLATAFPDGLIHAVDTSTAALKIAQLNAQQLNLAEQIQFYQGSWLEPLHHLKGRFSGIVSNPPYIPSALVPELQPEVAWHEPHLALDGGPDGLAAIRHLVTQVPDYLKPGGLLLIEMMAGQGPAVLQLLSQQGSYHSIELHTDLAGIERFALAHRRFTDTCLSVI
ncbi:MAG: peptide chain release factor N(5)-glutamine methyltransferase [Leptolyngbyaceae bacterium]|nr:peptide chain release factor N(5)-glutamine methyltransferase [Leptolyngbyaceae bacterium]